MNSELNEQRFLKWAEDHASEPVIQCDAVPGGWYDQCCPIARYARFEGWAYASVSGDGYIMTKNGDAFADRQELPQWARRVVKLVDGDDPTDAEFHGRPISDLLDEIDAERVERAKEGRG